MCVVCPEVEWPSLPGGWAAFSWSLQMFEVRIVDIGLLWIICGAESSQGLNSSANISGEVFVFGVPPAAALGCFCN
jgi:hypothetical protein